MMTERRSDEELPDRIEAAYYGFIQRANDEGIAPEQWDRYALTALWNQAQIEANLSAGVAGTVPDREVVAKVIDAYWDEEYSEHAPSDTDALVLADRVLALLMGGEKP